MVDVEHLRRGPRPGPSCDLRKARQLAGERAGIILTPVSDGCATAGILAEDVWLILEALHQDDFYETTRTHENRETDVYCVACGEHQYYLEFAILEIEGADVLIVSSFRQIKGSQ